MTHFATGSSDLPLAEADHSAITGSIFRSRKHERALAMAYVNGLEIDHEAGSERKSRQLPPTIPASAFRWKRTLDRLVAVALLLPALPVMAILVIVIRLTSPGPAIFCQERVGKHGRTFTMFKLRSMRVDAERNSGAIWAREDDPRITRVGRFLRWLHLDELPQLFNVLAGEMSLVGPRPERPEFVKLLSTTLDGYQDRHLVLPGVTGLAQINLPPDTDLKSVARKLALDLEYIESGSIWLDLRLLVCTAVGVFKFGKESWPRLLGVDRNWKGHPKYVEPDETARCTRSARELANLLVDKLGETFDGNFADTLEDLLCESIEADGNNAPSASGESRYDRHSAAAPTKPR